MQSTKTPDLKLQLKATLLVKTKFRFVFRRFHIPGTPVHGGTSKRHKLYSAVPSASHVSSQQLSKAPTYDTLVVQLLVH